MTCSIRKLLVANRGEIAIRAFRAAAELGVRTVAIYVPEDRDSVHRIKADEAYEIGERGHPVASYLDPALVIQTAVSVGVDAVYPGYGFMSESAELARRCDEAGLTFVGPPPKVLALAGDKTRARDAARACGVPVLEATGPVETADEATTEAHRVGFPLFVKAAHGGGGRGMRLVRDRAALGAALAEAQREARAAFGDGTVYLEHAMLDARHIEVQILADGAGDVVHLYERDCSVQRRHQKVVELTPAPNLAAEVRDEMCAAAVRFARHVGYENAGTVEFLVDGSGRYAFIEMNPRIQVEHTVTEETTDVDLVQAQLRIAGGATLQELGLRQSQIRQRGTALQCRVTTEDPANGFCPDTGTITAYRAPGGAGVRLDEGSVYVGAHITPFFDPLLVKISARGPDLRSAAARARRAVNELRVRGVQTNQGFLTAILEDDDFLAGRTHTRFVDERPHLAAATHSDDRASRLLTRLAEVTVARAEVEGDLAPDAAAKLPAIPDGAPPAGSRQLLRELGAEGFARTLRDQRALALTDTTLRDAHQSLFATRMRTFDILTVAPHIAHGLPQLLSLEAWGGATFDVALRFLHEDPWDRLAQLRERVPNLCLQMLLRGKSLLAYERFPDRVVRAFLEEAAATGIDIVRIFDALNDIDGMRTAIDATREAGLVVEGAICYTGDLTDPGEQTYTLDYYLRFAAQLVEAGAHVLAIKDMAGLLRPPAARTLVASLRSEFDLPVHLHTHDTAGGQLATYFAAIEAGVDAVDGAAAPMAGMTSQPSLSAIVAATAGSDRDPGVALDALLHLEPYWEGVRALYREYETGLRAPTGRVYRHQIPGGQLSNLRQQASALGLADRFEEVEQAYEGANALLGDIIKVTPTSKVVGDLALFAVSAGIDFDELAAHPEAFDLPDSVIGLLRGELGTPAGGFPQPFTSRALATRRIAPSADGRHVGRLGPAGPDRRRSLARLLFPGPTQDFEAAQAAYGDVSAIPTRAFFAGLTPGEVVTVELAPGVRVTYELEAVSEPRANGTRTVVARVNGQLRALEVRDATIAATAGEAEKANASAPEQVAAPVAGIVTVLVGEGDRVRAGDPVATLEAMKMESTVTAPLSGEVLRVAATSGSRVDQGDLILVLAPPEGEGDERLAVTRALD